MKKTVFECDVCKGQGSSIFEVKLDLSKMILGNGERDHTVPPINFAVQVCGLECMQKGVASKVGHIMAKVETKPPEDMGGT